MSLKELFYTLYKSSSMLTSKGYVVGNQGVMNFFGHNGPKYSII